MAKKKQGGTAHFKTIELHFLPDDMPEEEKRLHERTLARNLLEAYRTWVAEGKPMKDRGEIERRAPRAYVHGSIVQLDEGVPAEECRLWQIRAAADPDENGTTMVLCKRVVGTREEAEARLASIIDRHGCRAPEGGE